MKNLNSVTSSTPTIISNKKSSTDKNLKDIFLTDESQKRPHRDDYRFSLYPELINKPKNGINGDGKKLSYTAHTKLISFSGAIQDLLSFLTVRGNAFSPFTFKNNKRVQNNAELASFLVLDIDNGLTINQALNNAFIAKYGGIYTTPSHSDSHHKFRILIALPMDIDIETYKVLVNTVNDILGDVNDECTNEPARLFYGNNEAKTFNFENFSPLPYPLITEAMKVAKGEKEKAEKLKAERLERRKEIVANTDIKGLFDYAIALIPELPPRQKGTNQYEYLLGIVWGYCALFSQAGRSLDELKDLLEDSPMGSDRSQGWNICRIIDHYDPERENYEGKAITPFSIFHNLDQLNSTSKYSDRAKVLCGIPEKKECYFANIRKAIKKAIGFKSTPELPKLPKTIEYCEGDELPDLTEYIEKGITPLIEFSIKPTGDKEQDDIKRTQLRTKLINHLRMNGLNVLDRSHTGSGKSNSVPQLYDLVYLSTDYKNPTIEEIKEFPEMPPRSQYGLFDVNGKIKNDPPESERDYPISEGNCINATAIKRLAAKGYDVSEDNPICAMCDKRKECSSEKGWFKFEQKQAIAKFKFERRLRAHPQQIKPDLVRDTTLIFDEASRVSFKKEIPISKNDIIKKRLDIHESSYSPEQKAKIIEFLKYLEKLLDFDFAQSLANNETEGKHQKFYGLNHFQIMDNSPTLTDDDIKPFIAFHDELTSLWDCDGDNTPISERVEKLSNNWFIPLLMALKENDHEQGILSLNSSCKLQLVIQNDHLKNLVNSAKNCIFFDATAYPKDIEAIFGVSNLITIREKQPKSSNLTVNVINTTGMRSNQYSDSTVARIKVFRNQERHQANKNNQNMKVITNKRYRDDLEADGHFGADERGSNEFLDCDRLNIIGGNYSHIGDLKNDYLLLYGSLDGFEQWYFEQWASNIIQTTGRLRSHRRNVPLEINFVGSFDDNQFDFLKDCFEGIKLNYLDMIDVCPEAASKGEKSKRDTVVAMYELLKKGVRLTQKQVASMVGISQQAVSKISKALNLNWKDFKDLQLNLYKYYKEKVVKANMKVKEFLKAPSLKDLTRLAKHLKDTGHEQFTAKLAHNGFTFDDASKLLIYLMPFFGQELAEIHDDITSKLIVELYYKTTMKKDGNILFIGESDFKK